MLWDTQGAPREMKIDLGALDVAISADGRYVAYTRPTRLGSSGFFEGPHQIEVLDRHTGQHATASTNLAGTDGNASSDDPAISSDGSVVAFSSVGNDLVADDNGFSDVFVRPVADVLAQSGGATRAST